MIRHPAIVVCSMLAVAMPAWAQQGEWRDPSPHKWVGNADGTVARVWVPDPPVFQAMTRAIQAAYKPYDPEPIRVPVLAMYAVPGSAADLMCPWYNGNDSVLRESVQTLFRLGRESFGRHAKWFEALAARGRVIEISGAHHLFISNQREVLSQIDAFTASLLETP